MTHGCRQNESRCVQVACPQKDQCCEQSLVAALLGQILGVLSGLTTSITASITAAFPGLAALITALTTLLPALTTLITNLNTAFIPTVFTNLAILINNLNTAFTPVFLTNLVDAFGSNGVLATINTNIAALLGAVGITVLTDLTGHNFISGPNPFSVGEFTPSALGSLLLPVNGTSVLVNVLDNSGVSHTLTVSHPTTGNYFFSSTSIFTVAAGRTYRAL